jgi:3-oxoacyl-(acyl-carrier-protein) synthase
MKINYLLNKETETPSVDEFSAVCEATSAVIRPWTSSLDLSRTGIYTATSNAGITSSVAFWQLALEQEPRFMSPIHFPWTLASTPAAAIAMHLHITGPNYTLMGHDEAVAGIIEQSWIDIRNDIIENALLLAVDLGASTSEMSCFSVILADPAILAALFASLSRIKAESDGKKTAARLAELLNDLIHPTVF